MERVEREEKVAKTPVKMTEKDKAKVAKEEKVAREEKVEKIPVKMKVKMAKAKVAREEKEEREVKVEKAAKEEMIQKNQR